MTGRDGAAAKMQNIRFLSIQMGAPIKAYMATPAMRLKKATQLPSLREERQAN